MPEAVTLKLALPPATTLRFVGWAVTAGGTNTVKTATALITDPAVLVTTTV